MNVLKSRVFVCAIASIFATFSGARATTPVPEVDFRTATSKAYVDSLNSNVSQSVTTLGNNTINGAPLSASSYFYGVSSTAANKESKAVTISNLISPAEGQFIIIQPRYTSASGTKLTLNLNDSSDEKLNYNGTQVNSDTEAIVWNANYPSLWVFNGSGWDFAGYGNDMTSAYGTSDTGADTRTKDVTISSITALVPGQIIIVQPRTKANNLEYINLNGLGAIAAVYNGFNPSDVWSNNYPSTWVFTGNSWQFVAYANDKDTDTTYSVLDVLTGRSGTNTALHTISAQNLKAIVHGLTLTSVSVSGTGNTLSFTATNSAVTANDTIIGAFGKLQGQINNLGGNMLDNEKAEYMITQEEIDTPKPLSYKTDNLFLEKTEDLVWLPDLIEGQDEAAIHSMSKLATKYPAMDTLTYALYGLYQIRETSDEWKSVAHDKGINDRSLGEIAEDASDSNSINYAESYDFMRHYASNFMATLEALAIESSFLLNKISEKQDKKVCVKSKTVNGTQRCLLWRLP